MDGLERYFNGEYDDYKYGEPVQSAKNLIMLIEQMKVELGKAGTFLTAGMKQALINDVSKITLP